MLSPLRFLSSYRADVLSPLGCASRMLNVSYSWEVDKRMKALRQIYDSMPPTIECPEDLRSRRVEVVFLALDEGDAQDATITAGWSDGLFERTAGAWQGEPLRRWPQGELA